MRTALCQRSPAAAMHPCPRMMIAFLIAVQVNTARRQLGLRVSGFDVPRPVQTFQQCGFDAHLMAVIARAGYEKPTAIQAQAIPAALSGRDVLVRRLCQKLLPRAHCAASRLERAPDCIPPLAARRSVVVDCRALRRQGQARRRRSCCRWWCT